MFRHLTHLIENMSNEQLDGALQILAELRNEYITDFGEVELAIEEQIEDNRSSEDEVINEIISKFGVEFEETLLDEAVHDEFSNMATDTNNGGLGCQVKFLLRRGFTPKEILKCCEEA